MSDDWLLDWWNANVSANEATSSDKEAEQEKEKKQKEEEEKEEKVFLEALKTFKDTYNLDIDANDKSNFVRSFEKAVHKLPIEIWAEATMQLETLLKAANFKTETYRDIHEKLVIEILSYRRGLTPTTLPPPPNFNEEEAKQKIREHLKINGINELWSVNKGGQNVAVVPTANYIIKVQGCGLLPSGNLGAPLMEKSNEHLEGIFIKYYSWPTSKKLWEPIKTDDGMWWQCYIMEKMDMDLTDHVFQVAGIPSTLKSFDTLRENPEYLKRLKNAIIGVTEKLIRLNHEILKRKFVYGDHKLDNVGYNKDGTIKFLDIESGLSEQDKYDKHHYSHYCHGLGYAILGQRNLEFLFTDDLLRKDLNANIKEQLEANGFKVTESPKESTCGIIYIIEANDLTMVLQDVFFAHRLAVFKAGDAKTYDEIIDTGEIMKVIEMQQVQLRF